MTQDRAMGGAAEADAPAVDIAVIDQLASITDGNGCSVLTELLNAFLGAAPTRLGALDRALAAGDLTGVADHAHALTGSSASFGARGMASLCRRLRTAAVNHDPAAAGALLDALHVEFLQVRSSLLELTRAPS